jgi:hypothetical protein
MIVRGYSKPSLSRLQDKGVCCINMSLPCQYILQAINRPKTLRDGASNSSANLLISKFNNEE